MAEGNVIGGNRATNGSINAYPPTAGNVGSGPSVSSTLGVMLGMGQYFTPQYTGFVIATWRIEFNNTTTNTGSTTLFLLIGTGTKPISGATTTGAVQSTSTVTLTSSETDVRSSGSIILQPTSGTFLTTGTRYWLDMSALVSSSSLTLSFSNFRVAFVEMPKLS